MTTELRDFGDKATVVVFTDEQSMAERLRDRKNCLKSIAYEQDQFSKKKVAPVGWDFYFPKKEAPKLLAVIGQKQGKVRREDFTKSKSEGV